MLVWLVRATFAAAAGLVAVAAGALGFRLNRDVDTLRADLAATRGELRALQRRQAGASARFSVLQRELRVASHPLRAAVSWPVRGPVLDTFASRGGAHDGIDVDAPEGEAVRSAAPGIVLAAGWDDGYGNKVVVGHGRGLSTVYAHLSSIAVSQGVLVTEVSTLGTVGCTGHCTDAHLHFEVHLHGTPTDPLRWLPTGRQRGEVLSFTG